MIYINNILKIFILQCILLTFPLFLKSQIDTIHLKEVEVKELYFNSPNTNKHQIDNFRLMHSVSANIGEILSYEPGLNVKTFGDGSLTTVSFRGTDASHTKVDWNGMQINSAMNGQIDFSLIPALPYNNLNLFYGANSLITSSGAFGGQVSFNSPDFNKLSPFIEIKQEVGSFGLYNSYLGVSIGKKYLKSITQLSYHKSNNDFKYFNNAVLPTQEMTQQSADFNRINIFQDLIYKKNKNEFSLHYWQANAERQIPQIMTNVFSSQHIEKQGDKSSRISGTWNYQRKCFALTLSEGVSVSELNYNLEQYSGTNLVTYINSKSNEKSYFSSVSTNFCVTNNVHLNSSIKYDFRNVNIYEQKSEVGYNVKNNVIDAMVNLDFNKGNWYNVTLLSRFVKNQNFEPAIIPSVFFKLLPMHDIVIKTSLSHNTNYPNLNALYYIPGGNIYLKPENAWQSDLSVKYQKINNETELEFFYNNVTNWILWQPTQFGYWSPNNVRNVISKGLQIKTICNLKVNKFIFNLHGAYTFNIAKAKDKEFVSEQLPYLPIHAGTASLRIRYLNYEFCFDELIYGTRLTSNYGSYSHLLEPLWLTNLSVMSFVKIKKSKLSVEFKINNLFNTNYQLILWRPMPMRNASIVLSFKI